MNKVLIVDNSESDRWRMSRLLSMGLEDAKSEVMKLSAGAVIVTAMKFQGGTARELINWLKDEVGSIARYFLSILDSTHLLLDKKHTILSNTVDLLDKNDYLCSLIRLRNEKYNPQSKG